MSALVALGCLQIQSIGEARRASWDCNERDAIDDVPTDDEGAPKLYLVIKMVRQFDLHRIVTSIITTKGHRAGDSEVS